MAPEPEKTAIENIAELKQAKVEIRRLNDELEQRVAERTRQLAATNDELNEEIAERKRAEEALWQTQSRILSVLNSVADTHMLFDQDWRYLYVNDPAVRAIGRPRDQILGHTLWELFPDIIGTELDRQYHRGMDERLPVTFDFHYLTLDTWWENRFYPAPEGLSVVATNITERKRAEEALLKLGSIVEQSDDAIIGKSLGGIVTSWNKGAERIYGYTAEEIIGRPISVLIPLMYSDELPQILETIGCGERVEHYETVRIRKDGQQIHVSLSASPITNAAGWIVGASTIAQDITERKRAEQKLREYEKAVEGLDEMIVVIDRDYRYLLANHAFLKYRGLEREQLIGRLVPEIMNPGVFEDVVKKKLDECFEGNVVKYDLRFNYPTLGERDLFISYFPIEGATGIDMAACVLKDITESKRAEEQLKATSEQLRALSASLQSAREEEGTRIARKIHDELGAALSSLKWDLEHVDEAISESGDQSQLQELRKKIQAMMRLTDNTINTVRRIASELRPTALDALGVIEAIEWQAQQLQDRTGIIIQWDCTLENVDLSREQSTAVFRIFQEVFTNILRHAQATRVNIQMNEDDSEFILTIRDNGRGITDDEKSGKRTLGLLGMRERAHLIGGKIDINGLDGKGTVVAVRIPISPKRELGSVTLNN